MFVYPAVPAQLPIHSTPSSCLSSHDQSTDLREISRPVKLFLAHQVPRSSLQKHIPTPRFFQLQCWKPLSQSPSQQMNKRTIRALSPAWCFSGVLGGRRDDDRG